MAERDQASTSATVFGCSVARPSNRPAASEEVGSSPRSVATPVLAVVRAGTPWPYDDPSVEQLLEGDRIIYVSSPRDRVD